MRWAGRRRSGHGRAPRPQAGVLDDREPDRFLQLRLLILIGSHRSASNGPRRATRRVRARGGGGGGSGGTSRWAALRVSSRGHCRTARRWHPYPLRETCGSLVGRLVTVVSSAAARRGALWRPIGPADGACSLHNLMRAHGIDRAGARLPLAPSGAGSATDPDTQRMSRFAWRPRQSPRVSVPGLCHTRGRRQAHVPGSRRAAALP
jgi:hypothetical protein